MDDLDIEATSRWSSVRANTAVFAGKYYFEVTLKSSGLMQIGWCTLATPFMQENGVGDDETSYAYDGFRVKKWNKSSSPFGEAWSAGDIIGSMIDLERREISFWRNERYLGVAFQGISVGPNMAYFPAISLSGGERAVFNFGKKPFKVKQTLNSCAIQEPDCFIHNYYSTAVYIIETLKRYG